MKCVETFFYIIPTFCIAAKGKLPQTKESKQKNIFGMKKVTPKPEAAPKKPPRQHTIPSPELVQEATYAVTEDYNGDKDTLSSDYSQLNIGPEVADTEYDSISYPDKWSSKQKPEADSTYSTASNFPGRYHCFPFLVFSFFVYKLKLANNISYLLDLNTTLHM